MWCCPRVVEEDCRVLLPNGLDSTLPDTTTLALGPAALNAFAIFEDLCLLGNGERPQSLQLEYPHKTFSLKLVESVLTNYHKLFRVRKHSKLLLLLQYHLSHLLLKRFPSSPLSRLPSAAPVTVMSSSCSSDSLPSSRLRSKSSGYSR
ncbi:hypothetical protein BGY98DRAFT_81847 [Russula aff. rugulosa BPL654]|nr:hypothetical protein BGY98DRAFT_81847 [Russula aff. rugulosa BPL654]